MTAIRFRRLGHRHPQRVALRNQSATGRQQPLPRIGNRADVVPERGQHAAQVGNDHVGLLGQHDLGGKFLHEMDAVGKAVGRRDLSRHLNGVIGLDRVDAPRTELARQHREYPGAGADVDDNRARLDGLPQRTDVGLHARAVGDHLAVTGDAIRTHAVRLRLSSRPDGSIRESRRE